MKAYKFSSFRDKIEINIANISSSPDDKFRILRYYYSQDFTCELDLHKHCCYLFEIQNIQTQKILKVGSECVHHFKDKGIDMNLAEGLIKRIMKATDEARDEIRTKLGEEAWEKLPAEEKAKFKSWQIAQEKERLGHDIFKNMPREQKSQMTAEAYLVVQAKDLLRDFSINRAFIDEDEVKRLFDMGLADKYEEAKVKRAKAVEYDEYMNCKKDIDSYFNSLKNDWSDPDPSKMLEFSTKVANNRYSIDIDSLVSRYNYQKSRIQAYPLLKNYKGNNSTVKYMIETVCRGSYIYNYQMDQVKQIIESERDPVLTYQIEVMLFYILLKKHNTFVQAIKSYFEEHGFITDSQYEAIEKIYEELKNND